ncbi:unnamed protein product [Psylliodes chrysocephalus]|uniref:V-type proton ATPase subunit F n=1 Tax=Psylliodes chrysocephalus TaxID=3402493 RepID=A0A9P0D3U5_9CUCU|nr:unnamed protein product [Psylliodes chrysocephala]
MHSTVLYDIKEEEPGELRSDKISESESVSSSVVSARYLIAIIADEDTCVGYLLGGIGEIDSEESPNFFLFDQHHKNFEVEHAFNRFINRTDIGILLIQREAADLIHRIVHHHQIKKLMPVVLEIPGKNGPYDICIDHILKIVSEHEKENEDKVEEKRRLSIEKKGSLSQQVGSQVHLKRGSEDHE